MRRARSRAAAAGGGLTLATAVALLTSCAPSDDRVAKLEQEVQALRSATAVAPIDAASALAPLRGAVDVLVQRGDAERARWASVAAELVQLATLVQGVADDKRREEVDALRRRAADLDRQIQEQAKVHGEERELLLRALDLAASKLEVLLRQALPPKTAPPADGGGAGTFRRSWQDPVVVGALAAGVAGLLAVLWLSRASNRRPSAVELAVGPEVVVDAPAPHEPIAIAAAPRRGPLPVRVEVGTSDAGRAQASITRWLASDPRVLTTPAPAIVPRGAILHVEVFVHDGMCAAERASLAADVLLRGQADSCAGQRRT